MVKKKKATRKSKTKLNFWSRVARGWKRFFSSAFTNK
jgi:hypothetical protein